MRTSESGKKVINPILVYLMAGFMGLLVSKCITPLVTAGVAMLGADAIENFAAASQAVIVFSVIPYAIVLMSVLKVPMKTIQFVTMGVELLFIVLYFVGGSLVARITCKLLSTDGIWSYSKTFSQFTRVTAVWTLIGSLVAVPVSMWLKNRGWVSYLSVIAAAFVVALIITRILMNRFYAGQPCLGIIGNASGFFQPFCVFPFLASVSKARIDTYVDSTAAAVLPEAAEQTNNKN